MIDNVLHRVPAETVEIEIDHVVIFVHKYSLWVLSGTWAKVINLKNSTEANYETTHSISNFPLLPFLFRRNSSLVL